MNRNALLTGMTLAFALISQAGLADNANTSQKGSLLIYPQIDVRPGMETWVRLVNDYKDPVTVKCYYMDVDKQRVDFEFELTKNQPVLFDARTGDSPSHQVNKFPTGANYGELICFAVSNNGTELRDFNHLSGTATVVEIANGNNNTNGAAEYNAWAFRYNAGPNGLPPGSDDLILSGAAGAYDSCPAYLFGQFSPNGAPAPGKKTYGTTKIDIASCRQDLRQDYTTNQTKLQFDIWRYDETRLTGAYHCSNSFVEATLEGIKTAPQNFTTQLLRDAAYYRVQGVKSTQCSQSEETGLVGIQTSEIPGVGTVATEMGASNMAAKPGFVKWDHFMGLEAPK